MTCENHVYDFDEIQSRWVCIECGFTAPSDDPFAEPCLHCGAAVDADSLYCEKCLDLIYA